MPGIDAQVIGWYAVRVKPSSRNWLWGSLVGVLALLSGCVSLFGESAPPQKASFLKEKDQTCVLRLATGQEYELQFRTFRWKKDHTEMYTSAVAYYAPGSGAFLWWGMASTREQYLSYIAKEGKFDCAAKLTNFLLLQDGDWVAFSAISSGIRAYHSNLRFPSTGKGWEYVADHPDEMASWSSGKWVEFISVGKELGPDFFRPERLRFDARPYAYDSLTGVSKVGPNWQLEIKGADEPNRAIVLLDSNFKLLKVTKIAARSVPTR
jgi:hypothetical protein